MPPDDPYITSYYSGWRFRDQPEVVCYAIERIEGLEDFIDHAYYKRWVEALGRSERIKQQEKDLNYKFKMRPFAHQMQALRFSLNIPCAALFMEPGTGKTYVALVATEIRKRAGKAKKTLVVAPKSVLKTGWYDDMRKFTDLRGIIVRKKNNWWTDPVTGKSYCRPDWAKSRAESSEVEWPKHLLEQNRRKTLEEQLEDGYDIYITNLAYFRYHVETFLEAGFDSMIIDESTMIKNPSGASLEAARWLGNTVKYKMILTGTPNTNGLEDLWGQMKFLDNSLCDKIDDFRARYLSYPDPFGKPWRSFPKPGARREITKRIENRCLFISKDDCLDLPDRLTMTREVEPTSKIKKHYKEFRDDLFTRLESGDVLLADNKLEELLRLHQILQGHVGSAANGDLKIIEKPNKLDELLDIIDKSPTKVIVWAKYRQDFAWIEEALEGDLCIINGATSDAQAQSETFMREDGPKVMLAHPKSAKFGHTWNEAGTTVFYSYDYNLESYLQARDRNFRIGQSKKVTEYMLTTGGIEDKILASLQNKQNMAQKVKEDLRSVLQTIDLL